jgi:4-carboxymuconolactone decarboxylase
MKSWFTAVSSFAQPDEAATYDFLIELCTRHEVSDATFNQLRGLLREQQIVDLVTVSGTYVSVAMLLSAADQGVPAGKTPPLAPLDPK